MGGGRARRTGPAAARLAAGIDSDADPDFAGLAVWCRDLVDSHGVAASPANQAAMKAAFLTSSRYELAFWEMAWTLERWPI